MAKESGGLVARNIGRLVIKHALESRSPLYRWMHANYAQLKPVLAVNPSWTALSKAAAEAGQTTSDGKEYSRQIVWKTWRQLHRDMEAAERRSPPKKVSPKSTPRVTSPSERQPAPAPTVQPTRETAPDARREPVRGFDHESIVNEDDLRRRIFGLPPKED